MTIEILDHRTGFDIGWDWATYGVGLPDRAHEFPDFMAGYRESRKRVSVKENDRFIRKHLQLRFNAWNRNRYFDPEVTPEFLRIIDMPYCPITREPLTHGAMQLSDWSVDRIQNNAAYAPGNLVVVSTRANKLKGCKTHTDIGRLAFASPADHDELTDSGLNAFQWRRWLLISSLAQTSESPDGEETIGYRVAPCVIPPPPETLMNPSCGIQMAISRTLSRKCSHETYKKIRAALSDSERCSLTLVAKQAERVSRKMEGGTVLDIWHNIKLFLAFSDFYKSLDPERAHAIMESRLKKDKLIKVEQANVHDWHTNTDGYIRPEIHPQLMLLAG